MRATTADAYRLLHEGVTALSRVEEAGMRVDVKKMDRMIKRAGEDIKRIEADLKKMELWGKWRKRFGERSSLGSRQQLGKILFDSKDKKLKRTEKGSVKVDEEQLAALDDPFVNKFLSLEKLKKLRSTYLTGIRREVCGEYLHPSFNLHITRTYRSSSDSPNFQNIPIRDPKMGKPIRSCFIPRDGHALVEIDYSALEFRICACFWKDRGMVSYACDPNLDIHRDMAMACYMLDQEEVTKQARFFAKNNFVFPTLYGSWYKNTARNLWSVVPSLKTVSGVPLEDHLHDNGIRTLDAFTEHVKQVEEELCSHFPVWAERKEKWWNQYVKTGRFRLMTGFLVEGVYSRNNLLNYPIQGPAFHVLLWSLIELVKWTLRNKNENEDRGSDS
jgi:hypothetical protein